MKLNILKIAAFSYENLSGNPAGIRVGDVHPNETVMQNVAAEIEYDLVNSEI